MSLRLCFATQFSLIIFIMFFGHVGYSFDSKLVVPLTEQAWTTLAFNKIPKNSVTFVDQQLKVKVKQSAGPIIYKLPKPAKILEFSINGKVVGSKKTETQKFDEDSVLRFGLVAVGSKFLSGPKRWLAADWVKKLFDLAPAGVGLDKIYFYNFTNRNELMNQTRPHPKSDLIIETLSFFQETEGPFSVKKTFTSPIYTAALWISIDGDDTKSDYETHISEISLVTEQISGK